MRRLMQRIPSTPRCKLCAAPFGNPGGFVLRYLGYGPWEPNPSICKVCIRSVQHAVGGAEVEISILFADIRDSTTFAEGVSPADFSRLLNRFYEAATRAVDGESGMVDKFVGDGVIALFIPGMVGHDHAAHAIAAARKLQTAVMDPASGLADLPLGIGVHTGVAYVGVVSGGRSSSTSPPSATRSTRLPAWPRPPGPASSWSAPTPPRRRAGSRPGRSVAAWSSRARASRSTPGSCLREPSRARRPSRAARARSRSPPAGGQGPSASSMRRSVRTPARCSMYRSSTSVRRPSGVARVTMRCCVKWGDSVSCQRHMAAKSARAWGSRVNWNCVRQGRPGWSASMAAKASSSGSIRSRRAQSSPWTSSR